MILSLFYYCPPFVPLLPITNTHFLQIFFQRIQPPYSRSYSCILPSVPTTSKSLLWSSPPITIYETEIPLYVSVIFRGYDVLSTFFSSSKVIHNLCAAVFWDIPKVHCWT
jgi:hypothetical protein